ncbi:MAG TPA: prepilin-type N-terminal cleavage/methylation domain-containing protein [Noviherbaspirillum sp.]|jgi:MSHA pilin protein MshC|uniref:pilus assembly FimT family protein n=1 Tax=Noviherbaspirillum sp. TaxID=1926288 RepID=UPI002F9328BB
MTERGFTLVELVMVLVILGILAVFVLPRLGGVNEFRDRAFADEALSMLRHAQKQAIAQNTAVFVRLDGTSIALCHDADCAQPVIAPGSRNSGSAETLAACGNSTSWYCAAVPAGVSYTAANAGGASYVASAARFYFDGLGRPFNTGDVAQVSNFASRLDLTINGAGAARSIAVEQETGYVH